MQRLEQRATVVDGFVDLLSVFGPIVISDRFAPEFDAVYNFANRMRLTVREPEFAYLLPNG